ncbi:MAG: class I SAM-dependent methyltransferase [Candidatus Vogelbacteria bacterium]|nr:class I SAM-dependent methyltransferase [Candidatus Vogelbacteria bacterium]
MDPLTIETYEQEALEYDRETAPFWDQFPPAFIDDFAVLLPKPARVLNSGSGPGRDGALLFAAGLNVICLDGSQRMVDMSKKRGLFSVQGDFLHLPFDEKSFDGVWAYTAFLHVKKTDFPRALYEASRMLRGKGILALGMIEGEGETYRQSSGVPLPRLFAYYQPAELERFLADAGFTVLSQSRFSPGGKYTYLNILAQKDIL